jgi:hypothetical protein
VLIQSIRISRNRINAYKWRAILCIFRSLAPALELREERHSLPCHPDQFPQLLLDGEDLFQKRLRTTSGTTQTAGPLPQQAAGQDGQVRVHVR